MTVDECLERFFETGVTSFLPSAVAKATGLDQDTVCKRLNCLVQEGDLNLKQKALCSVCTECVGVFEQELIVPDIMFCRYCQQNRIVVIAPLLCFPGTDLTANED
ncbi:MAG: hypothetical protein ACOYEO_07800 [bacterium]|jgi:hypothetical protein